MVSKLSQPSAEGGERGNWNSGLEFLLSCISISIGLGNVWRFPTLVYANGGGAFLIPYFIVVLLVSKPLYYVELAFGQFAGKSPVRVWSCVPGFKGIGFAQMLSTFFLTTYINYIMAISLFYLFASMQSVLPWVSCDNADWLKNETCFDRFEAVSYDNASVFNISSGPENSSLSSLSSPVNNAKPAADIYFRNYVLQDAGSLDQMSYLDWRLVLCLLLSWTIVAVATVKGVKSLGKVVYVTSSYPYIVLIALLILALTMEGSMDGIKYFFTPDWEKLKEIKVWYKAAEQSFFSLNTGFGHLIMYASYNNFRHKVNTDALVISIADTLTSVLAGCVVFSVLGTLAYDMGKPIQTVVQDGGLHIAFVAYPEALGRIDTVPQLWSILFFIMLYMLGLGSSIGHVEAILTTIKDEVPKLNNRKSVAAIVCCIVCFICGLPLATDSGQYVMKLLDNYGVGAAVFLYGILELVGLMWIYGWRNFFDDLHFMLGNNMHIVWQLIIAFVSPIALIVIYSYGTADLIIEGTQSQAGIPEWGTAIGWVFAAICIAQIPIWFIVHIIRSSEKTFFKKLGSAFRPSPEWGPSDITDKGDWKLWKHRLLYGKPLQAYENSTYHI